MKTRDRIVLGARQLYNQRGYGNVSSATLAEHLGIAEGNLWYHFKTKRAILHAISEQFAQDIEKRLSLLPLGGGDIVDEYATLLQAIIDEFREYRFLYRDQADYGEHDKIVQQGARRWIERTHEQFRAYFRGCVESGLLDWPEERLPDLAINATIILRYGLEYFREMGDPIEEGGGAIRNTLLRHLTLFEYRLMPEAAIRLRRSIERMENIKEAVN
ncbi:TetR/AcrR family transcriptional regulator [Parasphingorhabdus halotolerans]|uniref:TetR/AcrR family transcriptional regulator n=1 Tax=Parasphingorhabdus halotolerans TaxID=2725558 RepID=A0A6H2DRV7_9SPHN|nr:TetR/AcrR family transcriptional regulator [Parasphingorhabdus halotolerans]QJB70491.1 TetR/AcrR family transcriptional regulator [Parasphingorhabdus halotolerans]